MINKMNKPYLKISALLILVFTVSTSCLYGCGAKASTSPSPDSAGVSTGKDASQSASAPQSTAPSSPNATVVDSLKGYISLLGLSKDKLIDTLKEEPVTIDEGGQEFKNAGIRVWFDAKSGTVNQVFTQNKSLDLNGAKIGDNIDKFKEKFGAPVSDNNGDMHFKYGDVFLSVNYDTAAGTTFALYILNKDF